MSESNAATDAGLERIITRYEKLAASNAGSLENDGINSYCKALTIVYVAKKCMAMKHSYWQMPLINSMTR